MDKGDLVKNGETVNRQRKVFKELRDTISDPYSYILLISFFETSFNYLRKRSVSVFLVLLSIGFLIQLYLLLKEKAIFGLVKSELTSRFILPMSIFLALLGVSLVGAKSYEVGYYFIRSYIGSVMLVFLIATNIKNPEKIRGVLMLLSVMALANVLIGILQVYVSSRFYLVPYIYPAKNAFYFNKPVLPHAFGLFMMNFNFGFTILLGSLYIVSRFINERRRVWGLLFLLCWGVLLYGYLISFLRSSIIALLLGSAIIIVATLVKRGSSLSTMIKKIAVFSLVTVIIVPSIFGYVHLFNKKKETITHKHMELIVRDKRQSDNVRITLYKLGLEIFLDHPLKGVGIGNYRSAKLKYLDEFKGLDKNVFAKLDPHNVFVEILCGAGIFALIVYLYVVLFPLIRIIRILVREKVPDEIAQIYILLIAYFAAALLDSNFHNFTFENMLWIGIGLFFAMEMMRKGGPLSFSGGD